MVAQIERRRDHPVEREHRLEELLADANKQLLDRDLGTFEILAARDRELRRAQLELERHVREIESLNRALADVQASRVWRLAERYRRLRNRATIMLRR